jgi:hypothetical protein
MQSVFHRSVYPIPKSAVCVHFAQLGPGQIGPWTEAHVSTWAVAPRLGSGIALASRGDAAMVGRGFNP